MAVQVKSSDRRREHAAEAEVVRGSLEGIPDDIVAGQTEGVGIVEVVRFLADLVGPSITALLAGVSEPADVAIWIRGETRPAPESATRLRAAFAAARLVAYAESTAAARIWLLGRSPYLNDCSPARAISDHGKQGVADALGAARAYLANG